MTTCTEPCAACSKQCEKDPGHDTYPGKINQRHAHDYEYISHSSQRKVRVRVTHEWWSDA